ncbi:MAG: DUF3626 domain-containing protein [Saprospiraceae bacterium]|nr:DUF3626 domain-containing protein [Saprospiraceae bacterium]
MSVHRFPRLSKAAAEALKFLREKSERNAFSVNAELQTVLEEAEVPLPLYLEALEVVKAETRIAIHFHPERLTNAGNSVIEGLLKEGRCLTQFETGISSGSPTGFAGGVRDEWERKFFGGRYHQLDARFSERPKYGALMLACYPDGPAPRFGSSYLILRPEVNKRSTYTFGGNQDDLAWKHTGSWSHLDAVFLPVLEQLKEEGSVLGSQEMSAEAFLDLLKQGSVRPLANHKLSNALDSYVEAQIHGPVTLREDVEKLVVDRSFYGTALEGVLDKLAVEYDIELDWYDGYAAKVGELPAEFRGYTIDRLVDRIAPDGKLTAAKIGTASNSFHERPDLWSEWGDGGEGLTYFRRVWHALVYHGQAG